MFHLLSQAGWFACAVNLASAWFGRCGSAIQGRLNFTLVVPGTRPVSREPFNLSADYPSPSLYRRHLPLYKGRLGRHLNKRTFPHVESDRFVRHTQ